MKTSFAFVHGGGWVKDRGPTRPKARLCGGLAVMWLALAVTALTVFSLHGWEELASFTPVPILLILAIHYFRSETPRITSRRVQNPACDPRKLY